MAAPFARFRRPSASTGQAQSCAHCSAPLAVGQTWCLECGTAAAGRLGPGPGLRSSLGVVGVTLLLVTGAVAAAYAALASQSKQATVQTTAQAAAQAPAVPDVAAGTVAPPVGSAVPAPSSAVPATAVPVAPKIPAATPTPAAAPAATTAPPKTTTTTTTPAKPKTKAKTPTTAPTTTGSGAPAPAAKSAKILLDTNAASSYDPYSLPLASFGDPARAIDGDPQTAWTYQLDPSTAGKTLVGLAINLNSAQTVRSVAISTSSPGMSVELYGATTPDAPVSISDPNWRHLATKGSLPAQATVKLKTGGRALRYLLVWITHAPPGATSVGISELSVSS